MIQLDTNQPTRLGGVAKPFANNNYARALFGIVHPIFSALGLAWNCLTAPSEISVNTEQKKFTGRLVLRALNITSGTAFLATATVGALQLAAVHWGMLTTISTLLAGAGISIGSMGIVPLIVGCCLVVGFASAFLSNCLEKRALSKLPERRYVLDTETHADKGKALALLVLKTLILPWGICACLKHLVQRTIMIAVHPGQNWIRLLSSKERENTRTNEKYLRFLQTHRSDAIKPIVLKKNGVEYSGWMFLPAGAPKENWIVHAVENYETAEGFMRYILQTGKHIHEKFNLLVMNPPGVGHSQGTSTPETLGEVQELALTFVENHMGATRIAMIGRSLGGASMNLGIAQHEFQDHVAYVSIPQMTFGSLAHLSQELMRTMAPRLTNIASPLLCLIGLEMDAIAGSQKLAARNIPEYVINSRDAQQYFPDGVIPANAALGARLEELGIMKNKTTRHHGPTGELVNQDWDHNDLTGVNALTATILQAWYTNPQFHAPPL